MSSGLLSVVRTVCNDNGAGRLTYRRQAGETPQLLGWAGGIGALCRSDEERGSTKQEQEAAKGHEWVERKS